jgi:hypothetical protein
MIGIILIVAAIWVGVEYLTEGEDAFGGLFSSFSSSSSSPSSSDDEEAAPRRQNDDWAGARVKQSVTKMHTDRAARIKERLGSD